MRPQRRSPNGGETPLLMFIIGILIMLLLVIEGRVTEVEQQQLIGGYNDNQMGSGNVVPRIQQQPR